MVSIVKAMTPAALAEAFAGVDWAKVDATTDADIARQAAEDPDTYPPMTATGIEGVRLRLLRDRFGLSQPDFAARFRIPVELLLAWEAGHHAPDPVAGAYLRVIEREPEAVARALAAG